jgi:HAD superfamily hydrolase (TIGR01458 family)
VASARIGPAGVTVPAWLRGVRAVVFDLEGTLYRGETAIAGAVEAAARVRAAGLATGYLTNTTSRGRRALADKLRGMGFEATEEQIFCPTAAAAAFLRERGESAWLLVPPLTRDEFDGVRREAARPDWIVVGDIGDDWSFEVMNRAFRLVHERGARLLALVRSRYWLADDGLRLDAGPFVAALEYATGTEALTFGKPDPGLFDSALRSLGVEPGQALMVGDDPVTDVAAAAALGMRTALVCSGKYRPGGGDATETSHEVDPCAADVVLASVDELRLH